MGYSPPKCTCHGKQSHSSKYMILLECLHAQSHVSSPHRLPHTCLSQMREKHFFQFCFSFLCYALTLIVLGCPGAYGKHYANSKVFMLIYFTCIYINIINSHNSYYSIYNTNTKISSHGLINQSSNSFHFSFILFHVMHSCLSI